VTAATIQMPHGQKSNAAWLACASPSQRLAFRRTLSRRSQIELLWAWRFWARPDQLPPPGSWATWLVMGGRGAGKTRTGAEWVRLRVEGPSPLSGGRARRIALVATTMADGRDVMIEGESGLLATARPDSRPVWQPSKRRVIWPNGAVAQVFSAEDPDSLRGPQFDAAWADELAKWRYGTETLDMLRFGLRLGSDPRLVATTTPKPVAVLTGLLKDATTVVTRATTFDNSAFLADHFLSGVIGKYGGTRLGRQELMGELLLDRPDALWKRDRLDQFRVAQAPDLKRIVVAVDPPAGSGPRSDECGIVVAGRAADGVAYVLADQSAGGLEPAAWAKRAVAAFDRYAADRLIAEANNGGEMVAAVIRQVRPNLPVTLVRASRGKVLRAEPVSALYEQGRVRHVGAFPELEDQMTDLTFDFDRAKAGYSPDRVDALVWAVTDLMLSAASGEPRVRGL